MSEYRTCIKTAILVSILLTLSQQISFSAGRENFAEAPDIFAHSTIFVPSEQTGLGNLIQ
ncbi:MAG: hypothetical protein H6Q73_2291 [Firmicutes bacterium]|nr:hypothetical protein [Bacillota bacterium]